MQIKPARTGSNIMTHEQLQIRAEEVFPVNEDLIRQHPAGWMDHQMMKRDAYIRGYSDCAQAAQPVSLPPLSNPATTTVSYPLLGYAPGTYGCKCSTCGGEFYGDKRAVQCEPCAVNTLRDECHLTNWLRKMPEATAPAEQPEPADKGLVEPENHRSVMYVCCVCKSTPVSAESGYDTCYQCSMII